MALSSLTMTGSTTNCSLYRKPRRCLTSSNWIAVQFGLSKLDAEYHW